MGSRNLNASPGSGMGANLLNGAANERSYAGRAVESGITEFCNGNKSSPECLHDRFNDTGRIGPGFCGVGDRPGRCGHAHAGMDSHLIRPELPRGAVDPDALQRHRVARPVSPVHREVDLPGLHGGRRLELSTTLPPLDCARVSPREIVGRDPRLKTSPAARGGSNMLDARARTRTGRPHIRFPRGPRLRLRSSSSSPNVRFSSAIFASSLRKV